MRYAAANIIKNNIKNIKATKEDRNTHKQIKALNIKFKENDIIHTKADKGNSIVIMKKNRLCQQHPRVYQ